MAKELSNHDVLATHVRDELGINEISQSKHVQAAYALGGSFSVGGILPFSLTLFLPLETVEYSLYGIALFFLIILGVVAAKTGASSVEKVVLRVTFWGTVAMGMNALVGYLFHAIT